MEEVRFKRQAVEPSLPDAAPPPESLVLRKDKLNGKE